MNRPSKKQIIIAVGVFVALIISYYIYRSIGSNKINHMPPEVVNAQLVKSQKWYTQIKATGTLSSYRGIMISSEVSGRITQINFKSGTFLHAGEPLFQIYPNILQAQLEQYKAMTKLAALDYARGLKLYQKSVISRQDLDKLTSTLQQDRALIAQTQAKLVQHNIAAPFDGQAGLRLVNEGDYVSPGQNLVTFEQLSPLRVQFSVPENYLPLLAMNQTVEIVPSSDPNVVETGTVYAFNSAIDPNTRAISMRAEIPNMNHKLIPGGFAEVTLFAGQQREVLTIPQTAINYSTLGASVYVIQADQTVKSVNVTTGERLKNDIEILSGLKQGEKVVTAGQIKLYEGAKVVVQPEQEHTTGQNQSAQATNANSGLTSSKPNTEKTSSQTTQE